MSVIEWAEKGRVPDLMIRTAIRRLLRVRLRQEFAHDVEQQGRVFEQRIDALRASEIALDTDAANSQHYEVPAEFFRLALGRHLKYSSGLWSEDVEDLDAAEAAMLQVTCERAGLDNGQDILELGCGWGSLTLFMAERFPASRITAVSNSASQRAWILDQAGERGLENLDVITCDVNRLELDQQFDRVVSVEMFEHVRNYEQLLGNVAGWMRNDAQLFVHIFCHRFLMYPFETEGDGNWMGRHFFTGGLMPAADTLAMFQDDLRLERRWLVSGMHYSKTARAWLERLDASRDDALKVFASGGRDDAALQVQRWRMFFMACEELFGFSGGNEWLVAHYRFGKR